MFQFEVYYSQNYSKEFKRLLDSQQDGERLVKSIGGVFAFKVRDGPDGKEATWIVDVKNGKGSVSTDPGRCLTKAVITKYEKTTTPPKTHTKINMFSSISWFCQRCQKSKICLYLLCKKELKHDVSSE